LNQEREASHEAKTWTFREECNTRKSASREHMLASTTSRTERADDARFPVRIVPAEARSKTSHWSMKRAVSEERKNPFGGEFIRRV